MSNVLGVGGVFFKCADPGATAAWYERVLGMSRTDFGGFMFAHARSAAACGEAAQTVFAPFKQDTAYFAPSEADVMINLMVDDLDAALARAAREGVACVGAPKDEPYGRFAWVMDIDGRKVELWQPVAPA